MSIEKHPTKQGYYYVKHYPNGRNGKPHRDLVSSYDDAVSLNESLKRNKTPLASKVVHPKLEDIIDEYLRWCKQHNSQVTYDNKSRRFEFYIIPKLGKYRVKDLNQRILDDYANGMKLWTYDTDYKFLSALITWMVKRQYADKLTWIMEPPKGQHSIKPVPHPSDMLKAIASMKKESHRILFSLMLYCGLRWNEARRLRWEDIDFTSWTIRVKEIQYAAQDYITVPIQLRYWFEANRIDSGLIWEGQRKGQPYSRLEKVLNAAGEAAGIHLTSHVFRHASATYLYEQEHDIYQVQAHLRHSRVTTSEIYARMSISRKQSAVQSIVDYVDNSVT